MKKTIKSILTLSALMMLASCGGDNKSSTKNGNGNVITKSETVRPSNTPNSIQSLYSHLSSELSCQGGQRLSTLQQYSIQGSQSYYNYSQNNLSGNIQNGTISGSTGQLYVGVSAFNDLMIVSEVTNGSSVLGHNIYISFCSYQNLVFEGRTFSNFQSNGIILTKTTSCSYGLISSAKTKIQANAYQSQYGSIYPVDVWTTFYPPNCN